MPEALRSPAQIVGSTLGASQAFTITIGQTHGTMERIQLAANFADKKNTWLSITPALRVMPIGGHRTTREKLWLATDRVGEPTSSFANAISWNMSRRWDFHLGAHTCILALTASVRWTIGTKLMMSIQTTYHGI